MNKIEQAIALLNVARALIEEQYATADGRSESDKDDLNDIVEDIGGTLYSLESFVGHG